MHSQKLSLSDTSCIKDKVTGSKTDLVKENLTYTKLLMEITHLNTDLIHYDQYHYNKYQIYS